jgi:DNA-binding GntR family transcriptional regulator
MRKQYPTRSTSQSSGRRSESGTITETAYNLLKQGILRGRFSEGCFLSESEVIKEFGFGRTPFREACNRLHHEELLEVVPRRGYLVHKLDFRQVRDFFEFRLMVEGLVAELAAVRASPQQVHELEEIVSRRIPGNSKLESEEIIQANKEFHLCLAKMSGNQELLKLMKTVLDRSERISYIELSSGRFFWQEIEKMHRPILEAIRKRDPLEARKAVAYDITDAQQSAFGQNFWGGERGSRLAAVAPAKESRLR